jgi:hypothetical protein
MASRPKELNEAFSRLTLGELGEGAEAIDLVVYRVARGEAITVLTRNMGDPAALGLISWAVNRRVPRSKHPIASARRNAPVWSANHAGPAMP